MENVQIIQINQFIKVFLASSEELTNDRNVFGNLIRRLNKTYEKRGIRVDLIEWEDGDAAYNNCRKQNEYNDKIRTSDMFLALFRTKAGKFTIEEFEVAIDEFQHTGKKPKNYVYIRDLYAGETETDELTAFKRRLSDEMGYFWIRYNNNDSLQLHFVMQLQLVEGSRIEELKIENGVVKSADITVANMDSLRFASRNEDYQRMSQRLKELPNEIEDTRRLLSDHPEEERYKDKLQNLLNERNKLQDDFDQQQQFLLDTAMRITRLQGERITDRMRRAMEAFEEGNVHKANIILDEAEHDADRNLTDYYQSKKLTEQKRQNVINSIEELLLKTSTVMADASILISERIIQVKSLYAKADHLAVEIDYDKKKYSDLLFDYAEFLSDYGLYKDAEAICLKQIPFVENLYGSRHPKTATTYNNIGVVYNYQGDYDRALEYYLKALSIRENTLGKEHPVTATSYNNIGVLYYNKSEYDMALEYYFKDLAINKKVHGMVHPDIATSYNNIGVIYDKQGNFQKALEYYFEALTILETVFGAEHSDTAALYNNIGGVYNALGNNEKGLEYCFKSLMIREKVIGMNHPKTAQSYNYIGRAYYDQGDKDKALEYYFKALKIREKVLGKEHPDTSQSYNNIGVVYKNQKKFNQALKYYSMALTISEKVLGKEHPDTATTYNNIGMVYYEKGDRTKALKYLKKAHRIFENVFGPNHPSTNNALRGIMNIINDPFNQTTNSLHRRFR